MALKNAKLKNIKKKLPEFTDTSDVGGSYYYVEGNKKQNGKKESTGIYED